jgi:hypothetical protein
MWTDPGNIQIAHRHMNVELRPCNSQKKEYIKRFSFTHKIYAKQSFIKSSGTKMFLVNFVTNYVISILLIGSLHILGKDLD